MTARFAAALVALTLVVLASLEIPLGVNHARQVEDDLLVATERDALGIGDAVEDLLETDAPDAAEGATAIADRYRAETGGRVLVVDDEGFALADTDPPAGTDGIGRDFSTRPEVAAALDGVTTTGSRSSETLGESFVYVAVPVRSGPRVLGAVRLSHSREEIDESIVRYWWRLAAIAGVTLVVAASIGLLLGRWVARPVRDLERQATRFGRGDLDARVETRRGPPEVRALAAEFDRTAERLANALRTTSQFAADAAHQLRTPLTVLRLRLDNLAAEPAPVDASLLDPLLDEITRLDRTIDVLLALAQLEERPPSLEPLDLHDALAHAAATWTEAAADAGVQLVHEIGPPASAVVDAGHLEQILDNLIANALAAVPAGTSIELAVEDRPDHTGVAVVDHGPGIEPEMRAKARQRHWHDTPQGTGLGLAIVDRLCRHNRGRLVLDETPGGGLTARVELPRPGSDGAPTPG